MGVGTAVRDSIPQEVGVNDAAVADGPILSVRNLHTYFFTYAGVVRALNGFDIEVEQGEMSALVGESGSGKSVLAWSILNLPKRPGKIVQGEVLWRGQNVLQMGSERLRTLRGKEVAIIVSNPRSQLHPLRRVGEQLVAVPMAHSSMSAREANEAAIRTLRSVELGDPERVFRAYPHELSGGMAQRILIAMALVNSPDLVIADDATNGLDVTVQRQVLDLMAALIKRQRASALMITHDLGIVAQYCRRSTIMYAGQAVESAPTDRLFENPVHPYTRALLASVRSKHTRTAGKPLPGILPDPLAVPPGCALEPRCPDRTERCASDKPEMVEIEPGHRIRCFRNVG